MILLDTHAFVWLASDQKEHSARAFAAIEKDRQPVFISAVVPWEMAFQKGAPAPSSVSEGICGTGDAALWSAGVTDYERNDHRCCRIAGYP